MEDYIFDGEPHALDKNWAYILKKIHEEKIDLKEEMRELYKKYAQYLVDCDKEKAVEYLMKVFQHELDFDRSAEDTSFIYRPPYMSGVLAQFATLALKFKRAKEDTLGTP